MGFVATETIQPQNLSVIGHILDLLMNIYTAFAVHIPIIPTLHIPLKRVSLLQKFLSVQLLRSQCSISAVRLFNLGGQGVQFATEYSAGFCDAALNSIGGAAPTRRFGVLLRRVM